MRSTAKKQSVRKDSVNLDKPLRKIIGKQAGPAAPAATIDPPALKMEKLNYIYDMLSQLRTMSETLDEPMILYLLEMALLETNMALHEKGFAEDARG